MYHPTSIHPASPPSYSPDLDIFCSLPPTSPFSLGKTLKELLIFLPLPSFPLKVCPHCSTVAVGKWRIPQFYSFICPASCSSGLSKTIPSLWLASWPKGHSSLSVLVCVLWLWWSNGQKQLGKKQFIWLMGYGPSVREAEAGTEAETME